VAPQYLSDLCQPVSGVASRQHLRSASRQLVVPRYRLSTYGRRAFAVAGPSVWNSLPDNLRDPAVGSDSFRRSLKTFLFATYWDMQRIRGSARMRYINLLLLTYLLTVQFERYELINRIIGIFRHLKWFTLRYHIIIFDRFWCSLSFPRALSVQ